MESRVFRDALDSLASVLLDHGLDRLHDLEVALEVGVDHRLVFILVIVPVIVVDV